MKPEKPWNKYSIKRLMTFLSGNKNLINAMSSISKIINIISITLFVTAMIMLAALMIYAKVEGLLPDEPWEEWKGNHGPWHFLSYFFDRKKAILNEGLWYVFYLQILSIKASFLSMILRMHLLNALIFSLEVGTFIITSYYFFWLID